MFKDGCWQRHKQQAAKQHEQQSGYNPDLCLTDVPVLQGQSERQAEKMSNVTVSFISSTGTFTTTRNLFGPFVVSACMIRKAFYSFSDVVYQLPLKMLQETLLCTDSKYVSCDVVDCNWKNTVKLVCKDDA